MKEKMKKDYSSPSIEILEWVAPEEFCAVASGEANQGNVGNMPWE